MCYSFHFVSSFLSIGTNFKICKDPSFRVVGPQVPQPIENLQPAEVSNHDSPIKSSNRAIPPSGSCRQE